MRSARTDGSDRGSDEGVIAISFQEEAVGKRISQTKKRYWWRISLARQEYEICFATSRLSGRKSITVNGNTQYEEVTPLARLTTFMHSWNLRGHSLSIIPTWAVKETVYRTFDLSIDGIPFDHLLEGARPGASMPGAPVPKIIIKILAAKGLRAADWSGSSDPYCMCEIPGKRGSKFQTAVINKSKAPQWNHEHTLADYTAGDPLYFRVMDKDVWPKTDDLLGQAKVASEQFFPWGFDGWLKLEGRGQHEQVTPMLKLQIVITGTVQEQGLRDMFDRCDQNGDGSINKRELIKILRVDQDVADFFGLPQHIRQEDGSRDDMERIFQEMDKSGNREVSWEEFRAFFSRRPQSRSTPPTPESRSASPREDCADPVTPRRRAYSTPSGGVYETPVSSVGPAGRASGTPASPSISMLQRISMKDPPLLALPGEAAANDAKRASDSSSPGAGLLEVRPKQTESRRKSRRKPGSVSPRSEHVNHAADAGCTAGDAWGGFADFGAFSGKPAYAAWPDSADSDVSPREKRGVKAGFDESCSAAFKDISQWGAIDSHSPTTGDDAGSMFNSVSSSPMPADSPAAESPFAESSRFNSVSSSPMPTDSPAAVSPFAACARPASNNGTDGHHHHPSATVEPGMADPRTVKPEISPRAPMLQTCGRSGTASFGLGVKYELSPASVLSDDLGHLPPGLVHSEGEGASQTSLTPRCPWGYAYAPISEPPAASECRPSTNLANATSELVDPWGNKYSPAPSRATSPVPRHATPCW